MSPVSPPPGDHRMKFDLREFSGAMGDLGLFIPIVLALVTVCGMDGGSILLFAGLFNIATGLIFNQPVPVQPMKAIAAVAIAEALSAGEIAAAGFATGVVIFALGATGLVTAVERLVPRPVVRGIQLGVGLKLLVKGLAIILAAGWLSWDGRLVALVMALFVIFSYRHARFPSALAILAAGFALMLINRPEVFHGLPLGWTGPGVIIPGLDQWKTGVLNGAIPQVPLTLLNSVIAVCALSEDLFPKRGIKTAPVAMSVGLMNISSCLFGAMPMCHGSGGLAGQYLFGARTGGSVVMLGGIKVALAVVFGSAIIGVLEAFPASVLGVMLAFSGLELAAPARNSAEKHAFMVTAATAGGILAVNTAAGFVIGLIVALTMRKES